MLSCPVVPFVGSKIEFWKKMFMYRFSLSFLFVTFSPTMRRIEVRGRGDDGGRGDAAGDGAPDGDVWGGEVVEKPWWI
jgi:hypothetical protein